VLPSGAADPAWPANGRALCTATLFQLHPSIVSDGAGGAIVAWYDSRSGTNNDIYAQHVLASGVVDPAWPANGRALCTAPDSQQEPKATSDGAGGAIVVWHDNRGGAGYDIYAQHVLATGAVDPAWPADGRALSTATNSQSLPALVSDGAGGAVVTWMDYRSGAGTDIYAQHVLASGAVDPTWPADGLALCTAGDYQEWPTIISDGAGGAIVAWEDYRSGTNNDIYAQHALASGAADPVWPAEGRPLCTTTGDQYFTTTVSDGAGGAIIAWEDARSGVEPDIYAHHLLASGAVDPAWPADGRAVCTAVEGQRDPKVVSDGAGGILVAWRDNRSESWDIYVQHVPASGAADPAWPPDGRALCTAGGYQDSPTLASDGAGGAIVAWPDSRAAAWDIYAQRVARFDYLGTPEAEIASVRDVPNDQGGRVKLSWNASYLDVGSDPNLTGYDVLRSVPPNVAALRLAHGARVVSTAAEAADVRLGVLWVVHVGTQFYYWEYLTTIPALHYVSGYSYLAPTAEDSTGLGNPKTAFMVVARNAVDSMYWPSAPDSGYSVDNLAPVPPAPFTGQYAAGVTRLHWNPNAEPDLAGYRLYRGTTPDFVPGPANLVAAQADTGYVDNAGRPYYYKLAAVDIHGNASGFALLLPDGAVGVGGGAVPAALWLGRPTPNPMREAMTIRFGLPRGAQVAVGIYDASGRRVRELASSTYPAGEHAATWDGRAADGQAAPSGLYWVRLAAEGQALVQRLVKVR
jgi:hypothetical protein